MQQWCNDNNRLDGIESIIDGEINMERAKELNPSLQQYQAFKWCADKGDGWYFPARYELHALQEQWRNNQDLINNNILLAGGEAFSENDSYFASSESRSYPYTSAELYSFIDKGWTPLNKSTIHRIRAIKEFIVSE